MYLKALTLRGFKSFASATTLRLEPGITCVVGPNGSGKSNVVDALSWVMGEQGVKSLRGANMSDVIFAGTSGRSPLGRAQVELTIDNSDGRLPIEYSEVTISRTLFRGGGSEYTINGAAVRLLDVQELLSDTGMGKQMHVIVGQGQLDAVLRSTPEERRGFIDEAAGVLKHRRRKERALRKLEAMDANLVRVLDLTEEIRRQLRPLARQAKAAREAAGVQERIDYAQRRLVADDLITSTRRMERDQAEAQRARTAAAGHDARIAELRQLVAAEQESGAEIQVELQRFTEMWHQFDSLHERLSSVVDLSAERLAQAQPRGQQVSEAQIELSEEKAAETSQVARLAEQAVAEQRSRADTSAFARAEVEREAERTARDLREREEVLERRRREQAKAREAQVSAASLVEAAQAAVTRAENALAGAASRAEEARAEATESTTAAPSGTGESSLADRHAASVEQERRARRSLEELQAAERDARAELARWQARRDALASSLPKERLSTGAEPAEVEPWSALGSLEQGLRVSRGWERAISALLIPFEQAPVIANDVSIESGMVRAAESGSPLRAVVAEHAEIGSVPAPPAAASSGSLPAVKAVAASAAVQSAVAELLGDAWLADSIGEARRILEGGIARTVATPDGLVLTPHSVRGPGEDAVSTLLIRTQWEDAGAEAERRATDLADIAEKMAAGREALNAAAGETAAALKLLREHDAEQARTAQAHARVAARIGAAEDEQRRAEADVAASQARLAEAETRLAAATEEMSKLPSLEAEPFLEGARRAVDDVAARVKAASEREMADKLALRGAEEQLRSATRQADAFRTQVEQLRQTRLEQGRREELLMAARQRISQIKTRAERFKAEALENGQAAKARKTELEEQVRQAQTRLLGLQRGLEDLQWKQNHAGEARQQAEVALAGSSLLHDQHREKALELVGSTEEDVDHEDLLAQLLAEYGPEQPVLDAEGKPQPYQRAAMVVRLDAAQKELSRLGVVNPLAVEEHAALTARHEFLTEQVADLKKSKSDLLAIIDDVDERVREAFVEAFAETQAQFERVFGILFPGGRGHLSLTDPDDPLTTGVEIYARPAGKRVTRLSLLSGGERSLAALAFLVAIFQARPSPFYVMDEVEAALDDINLSRVLAVLEELRANSQLILITHQKRTMEIADALYGVSMRQGTTTVVSHRLKPDQDSAA